LEHSLDLLSHHQCVASVALCLATDGPGTYYPAHLKEDHHSVASYHSEDDQSVVYVAAGPKSAKLLKQLHADLYKDIPHRMPATQAEKINADLLAFLMR
jgi:non-heme chloroperoxidase